jgi:hypothetical protein
VLLCPCTRTTSGNRALFPRPPRPTASSRALSRPLTSSRVLSRPTASSRVLPRPLTSSHVLPRPTASSRVPAALPCLDPSRPREVILAMGRLRLRVRPAAVRQFRRSPLTRAADGKMPQLVRAAHQSIASGSHSSRCRAREKSTPPVRQMLRTSKLRSRAAHQPALRRANGSPPLSQERLTARRMTGG